MTPESSYRNEVLMLKAALNKREAEIERLNEKLAQRENRSDLEKLIEARDVLRTWADKMIVVDTCIPAESREPGCLSCDTLHFFDVLNDVIAEASENAP